MYLILLLILFFSIIVFSIIYYYMKKTGTTTVVENDNSKDVQYMMLCDNYLNRILIIETIHQVPGQEITLEKIDKNIEKICLTFSDNLGTHVAERVKKCLIERHKMLIKFYENIEEMSTNLCIEELNKITTEIIDSLKLSILKDEDTANFENMCSRVENLFNMYNQTLVYQAVTYCDMQYFISSNHGQSSLELSQHLGNELSKLSMGNKTIIEKM